MGDADVEMADAPAAAGDESKGAEAAVEMVLPMVDESLLGDIKSMGFDETIARKALMGGSSNAEQAVNWILSHENDAGIADPIPLVPKGQTLSSGGGSSSGGGGAVAKSIKCVATGRLFRNTMEAQAYAEKTGRTDFEECTEEKKPLTAEEKKAKLAELKALAAARRAEREGLEKIQDIDGEKKRREAGQKAIQTKEQLEKAKRIREIERVKREKNAEKKERERLRAEIAKDKAERRARGGKLAGRLGVDGYNPSIDNNEARRDANVPPPAEGDDEAKAGEAPSSAKAAAPAPRIDVAMLSKGKIVEAGAARKPDLPPAEAVDKAIATLQKYKTAGDGGVALKTLGAYVRNALTKGDQDPKFRNIPTDGNAFKKRVAPLVGGVALLKAIGFVKNDDEAQLQLALEARDANMALLKETLDKLEKGYEAYMTGKV